MTTEATKRRQVSCPNRTIIQANQLVHFRFNAELQAKK